MKLSFPSGIIGAINLSLLVAALAVRAGLVGEVGYLVGIVMACAMGTVASIALQTLWQAPRLPWRLEFMGHRLSRLRYLRRAVVVMRSRPQGRRAGLGTPDRNWRYLVTGRG